MSRSNFIQTAVLSISLIGLSTSALQARDLTPREQLVCGDLRACLDIASRHTASEFDYDILETEFMRFGQSGKAGLFSLLESKDGHADIAQLISRLGPLTAIERRRVQTKWTQDRAQAYLPLLLDGHPMSRDLLLQSLGHPNAATREQVRLALLQLPAIAERAPLSETLRTTLLAALQKDPIIQAAPYLQRLSAEGYEREFIALLGSGEAELVSAAYSTLYRSSPSKAFNGLLSEMGRIETPAQARAIGQMLAARHKSRTDGFYHKFARDMSGDPKLSVLARASGLHAMLTIAEGPFPELTPPRLEAFSVLIQDQPFIVQDQYVSYLQKAKAQTALSEIWKTAQSENWINRDRIAEFYSDHPLHDDVVSDLLRANDIRTFSAGLQKAKPNHRKLIQAQIDHVAKPIASAARQHLKLRPSLKRGKACPVKRFDLEDVRAQMPFFESGWMVANNKARVSLSWEDVITAHPTATGWLAGYDLSHPKSKSIHHGGTLLHYENSSGEFQVIGNFSGPLAILPGQNLKLGQTTQQFWIIDVWGPDGSDISAYRLNLSASKPRIDQISALPNAASGFAVNLNGDLIMTFEDKNQMPIKLSSAGVMSSHCPNSPSAIAPRAPK